MLSTSIRRQANRYVLAKRFNAVGKEFSRKTHQFVVGLKVGNGHCVTLPIESYQFVKGTYPSISHIICEAPLRARGRANFGGRGVVKRPSFKNVPLAAAI